MQPVDFYTFDVNFEVPILQPMLDDCPELHATQAMVTLSLFYKCQPEDVYASFAVICQSKWLHEPIETYHRTQQLRPMH